MNEIRSFTLAVNHYRKVVAEKKKNKVKATEY